MAYAAGNVIYARCMAALEQGTRVADVPGHPGKAAATGPIWLNRHELFDACCDADDPVAALEALP